MSEKLEKILKRLGLTDSEIKTYDTALRRGPSAASELADSAGLTRQSIYNAVSRLSEYGLISTVSEQDRGCSVFVAENPRRLLDCAKRRLADLEAISGSLEDLIPELELVAGGDRPAIRVLTGNAGLQAAMTEVIDAGEGGFELVDFGRLHDSVSEEVMQKLHEIAKNQEARDVKAVYTDDAPPQVTQMVREAAYLPTEDRGFGAVVSAFGNKVVMVSLAGKMHTVIIDDECLAGAVRLMLRHTFEHAKEG